MTRGTYMRTKWVVAAGLVAVLGVGPVGAGASAAGQALAVDEPRGKNAWWYATFKLGKAHEQVTGKGVVIALVDDPVDPNVPELKGQNVVPVANVCGGPKTASGPLADHGTQMATIIVGNGKGNAPGGVGTMGVAPGATLRVYALDTSTKQGIQCTPSPDQGFARAVDLSIADGARIVSYAGGGADRSPVEAAAVQRAIDAGVIVVAAVGDKRDPAVLYPAALPGVVAAVAVDRNANPWEENPVGRNEANVIGAPGVDMPISGFDGTVWKSTGLGSGTSEATSFVTGALALAMERWPKATGNQILQHLIRTPAGRTGFVRDTTYGYGIVSVTRMLAQDPMKWPDVNPLLPGGPDAPVAAGSQAPSAPARPSEAAPVVVAAEAAEEGGGSNAGPLVGVGVVLVLGLGAGGVLLNRRRAKGS